MPVEAYPRVVLAPAFTDSRKQLHCQSIKLANGPPIEENGVSTYGRAADVSALAAETSAPCSWLYRASHYQAMFCGTLFMNVSVKSAQHSIAL